MKMKVTSLFLAAMMFFSTGCSVDGSVSVSRTQNTNGTGSTTVSGTIIIHKMLQQSAIVDAVNASGQSNVSLFDVPASVFPPDTSTTPKAIVTVTTDNGLTFSQTFTMVQVDASSYGAGASGTQTYAYTPQSQSAVASFVQSAASQAISTVSVDVQAVAAFVDPQDGNSYTFNGRAYNPSTATTFVGSASYTSVLASGGGTCHTRICPNQ